MAIQAYKTPGAMPLARAYVGGLINSAPKARRKKRKQKRKKS